MGWILVGNNIVFRTDASLKIGTGHVMRCLTLADALQASGAKCYFVCREHPGNLINQIRQRGFPVCALPNPPERTINNVQQPNYEDMLGVKWAIEEAEGKSINFPKIAQDQMMVRLQGAAVYS